MVTAWTDHHAEVYAFLVRTTRDPEVAEDLLSEAYLRLTREVRAGRAPDNTRAWLYRVGANLAVSRGRRLSAAFRGLVKIRNTSAPTTTTAHPRGELPRARGPGQPGGGPGGPRPRRPGGAAPRIRGLQRRRDRRRDRPHRGRDPHPALSDPRPSPQPAGVGGGRPMTPHDTFLQLAAMAIDYPLPAVRARPPRGAPGRVPGLRPPGRRLPGRRPGSRAPARGGPARASGGRDPGRGPPPGRRRATRSGCWSSPPSWACSWWARSRWAPSSCAATTTTSRSSCPRWRPRAPGRTRARGPRRRAAGSPCRTRRRYGECSSRTSCGPGRASSRWASGLDGNGAVVDSSDGLGLAPPGGDARRAAERPRGGIDRRRRNRHDL